LPGFSDADLADTHTKVAREEGASALPSFVSFNSDDFQLIVEPTSSDQVGDYVIEVVVTDSDSANSGEQLSISGTFTLTVNPFSCF